MSPSTARLVTIVFGIVYVAIGVLGFVPGITQPGERPDQGLLLGIFAVNAIHNVAHLILGALMLWAASSPTMLRTWARVLAGVFVVLAIGSFVAPAVEGLALNLPDSLLHILTAIVFGVVGFTTTWDDDVVAPPTTV